MKKKVITAFVASVTLLSLTATSTMASQLEEDFNTKTSCYNDETGIIHVIDVSNDNKELFIMEDVGEIVYTTADVNLRVNPTVNQDPYAVIPKGVEMLRVGIAENGWSMIQIEGVNYFIASKFITKFEPDQTIIKWNLEDYKCGKAAEEAVTVSATSNSGNMEYVGNWTISFYCNCSKCCGQWANGATAMGTTPTQGRTVACGSLPFGTRVYIEGWGEFIVEDRGVEGAWIDMYRNSHDECNQLGLQNRAVYIVR